MTARVLGFRDGHCAVNRQALCERSADRHECNRRAFVGHLLFIVTVEGRHFAGFDRAFMALCSVIERVIRRLFA